MKIQMLKLSISALKAVSVREAMECFEIEINDKSK